jgi:hypothetical protein
MPTRTISVAGGNWNATGTWVGGVVPIAGDDIIGDATSGNLTINVATANMLFFNLSNYLGTLTLNQAMNINGGVGNTTTFSPTMSFATATSYSDTNGICFNNTSTAHSIRTNGKKLPWVASLKGGGANSLTLLDNLNCETLSIGYGNANTVIGGTFSINLNHLNRSAGGGGSFGFISAATTAALNFVGPTASYRVATAGQSAPICITSIRVNIDVGTNGTFSTISPFGLAGGTTTNHTYNWISGNLGGTKELLLFDINNGNNICRLDFAGAGTWSNVYYNDINTTAIDRRLELNSNLFFNNMEASPTITAYSATTRRALTLSGTGALKGGRLKALPYLSQILFAGTPLSIIGSPTYSSPMIRLNPGATHVLSDIEVKGDDTGIQFRNSNNQVSNNALIASATASVRATLNFTGSSDLPSFWVQYTDIDASGGNMIYNFGGSQSNSLNIGTASFGGGSATTAFTFVN